jgi:hypothetical protein
VREFKHTDIDETGSPPSDLGPPNSVGARGLKIEVDFLGDRLKEWFTSYLPMLYAVFN